MCVVAPLLLLQSLLNDHLVEVIGGVVVLALGVYASREAVILMRTEAQRLLGQPKLVRESSKKGLWGTITSCGCCRRGSGDAFAGVFLPPQLKHTLVTLATSTR